MEKLTKVERTEVFQQCIKPPMTQFMEETPSSIAPWVFSANSNLLSHYMSAFILITSLVLLIFAIPASAGVGRSHPSSTTLSLEPDECRGSYAFPQCLARAYYTFDNAAYSGNGHARPAVAKDVINGYSSIHSPDFINDGYYGNGSSWIPGSIDSWVKIDLGRPTLINGIRFARDRTGHFNDRPLTMVTAISVALEDNVYANGNSSLDDQEYTVVYGNGLIDFFYNSPASVTKRITFQPAVARYIKIQISDGNAAIDEIEVTRAIESDQTDYSAGNNECRGSAVLPQCLARTFDTSTDLAFSGNGALPAVAKDTLVGYPIIHEAVNVNDGKIGNGSSWISASANSWIKIDLGRSTLFNEIRFGRDRTGNYNDRGTGRVIIFAADSDNNYVNGNDSNDANEYRKVYDSDNAYEYLPWTINNNASKMISISPVFARFVKVQVQHDGAAIDELEISLSEDALGYAPLDWDNSLGVNLSDQDHRNLADQMIEHGDHIKIEAHNGSYLDCSVGSLLTTTQDFSKACNFAVEEDGVTINLKTIQGYLRTDSNGNFVFNGSAAQATDFTPQTNQQGSMKLQISPMQALMLTAPGLSVGPIGDPSSLFKIHVKGSTEINAGGFTSCEIAEAQLVYGASIGFIFASGGIPYIIDEHVATGFLAIVRTSPALAAQLDSAAAALINNPEFPVLIGLEFAGIAYNTGHLIDLIKFAATQAGWYGLGWAIKTGIEMIFLPEAEVAELAASMTVWGVQMGMLTSNVIAECNN